MSTALRAFLAVRFPRPWDRCLHVGADEYVSEQKLAFPVAMMKSMDFVRTAFQVEAYPTAIVTDLRSLSRGVAKRRSYFRKVSFSSSTTRAGSFTPSRWTSTRRFLA